MIEELRIDLFCEDRSHEQFVRALVGRLARELEVRPLLRAVSTRGGHGKALSEFETWQKNFVKKARSGPPDLLVLVLDANCEGWNEAHRRLTEAIEETIVPHRVVGCPDPHVERWYMADPASFQRVVGVPPARDPDKCERQLYKGLVEEAVREAGIPVLTGPPELAPDLVAAMDLFRAGKNQPSLRHFVDDLRGALQRLAAG